MHNPTIDEYLLKAFKAYNKPIIWYMKLKKTTTNNINTI